MCPKLEVFARAGTRARRSTPHVGGKSSSRATSRSRHSRCWRWTSPRCAHAHTAFPPRGTDDRAQTKPAHHGAASVALQRPHREAGIGLETDFLGRFLSSILRRMGLGTEYRDRVWRLAGSGVPPLPAALSGPAQSLRIRMKRAARAPQQRARIRLCRFGAARVPR